MADTLESRARALCASMCAATDERVAAILAALREERARALEEAVNDASGPVLGKHWLRARAAAEREEG